MNFEYRKADPANMAARKVATATTQSLAQDRQQLLFVLSGLTVFRITKISTIISSIEQMNNKRISTDLSQQETDFFIP